MNDHCRNQGYKWTLVHGIVPSRFGGRGESILEGGYSSRPNVWSDSSVVRALARPVGQGFESRLTMCFFLPCNICRC